MRPKGSPSGLSGGNGLSSRHFLKLVEESIDVGLWSADIDSDVLQASVGLYRVLGLDPQLSLNFGHLADLMHPEDRRLHSSLLALLRSGQAVQREFRIIRPDRSQRWISSRAEVILGKNDRPSHALGIIRDVTDVHQARKATELEHDRFKALLDATAAVLWINKPNGEAQDMPQWRELTGQTMAEMQGAGWLTVVHPDDRAQTRLAWQTAVAQCATYNADYRVLCRDGIYRWFNARGVPILNQDGSVREWVGVCLSIVDQKRPSTRPTRTTDTSRSGDGEPKITAGQIRAARAMIDLSAEDLARTAGVSVSTIRRLEGESLPGQARDKTLKAIRVVLERSGVTFTLTPRSGVRLS